MISGDFRNLVVFIAIMPNSLNDTVPTAEVSRVALKLPQFWEKSPELWFVNIEAQFRMSAITADSTQYYAVIAALNADTLMHVSDIVLSPPSENMYQTVKDRLVAEFTDSEQKKLKTLLSELSLGDDKPSMLLRKMRQLAGTKLNDELLKTLWLQRLPSQTQAILSVSEDTLEKLAVMADKIGESTGTTPANCYAVAQTEPRSEIAELRQQVSELTEQMKLLTQRTGRRRYRSTSRQRRGRARSQSHHRDGDMCWYHKKFGNNAEKCNKPCSFVQNSGN